MPNTIWINARFLTRPTTGVERVAREILNQLSTSVLDEQGCAVIQGQAFEFKLIAPGRSRVESPWDNLPLVRRGAFSGHLWEQFSLPLITGSDWLISLCNTGPLFKRNHCLFLHDAQPFAIPANFSFAFRNWYRWMFRTAGQFAKLILVNSAFTRSELNKYVGIPEEKMTLCYLGGDHVTANPVEQAVLDRFTLPEGDFILAVSSMNPNKNIASLAKSLEQLGKDAPDCVVVGTSGHGHFSSVSLDSDKIHLLGYVSDAELCALYTRASCLVFPSFYEGFGLPIVEAMTLSCPVISSETTSMKEIGADAIAYCDPGRVDTLTDAIRRVINSPELREQLRVRGRQRSADFVWERTCQSMMNALSRELTCDSSSDLAPSLPLNKPSTQASADTDRL